MMQMIYDISFVVLGSIDYFYGQENIAVDAATVLDSMLAIVAQCQRV